MRDDTGTRMAGADRFPATRHSAVLAAQSDDVLERERGLTILIDAYWKPAYKYLRLRHGASNEDAKDLTQGFFTRAIEKDFFGGYDAAKGSFRTFLRVCLDRFVANELKSASRAKRAPEAPMLSLDFDGAEGEFARSIFELAVEQLRVECAQRGRDLPYMLFDRYELDRDPDERLTYEKLAEEFHIPATQVTNFLAFARREFRRIVLEKLREITSSDREFREEAKGLLGVAP
jgi:DNA-directed RNA polymerase specialized sigma24 family protein